MDSGLATVPSQVRGHRSDERISGGVHEHRKQHRVRTGHGQILRLQAPYLQCDSNRSALRAAIEGGRARGHRSRRLPSPTAAVECVPPGSSRAEDSRVVGSAEDGVVVLAAVEDAEDGDLLGLVIDEGSDHRTLPVTGGAKPRTDVIPQSSSVREHREALAVGHDGIHVIGSNRRRR